jgi:hypothetical protein
MPAATERTCAREGCESPLPTGARADARYCSGACRTRAYADRQRAARVRLIEDAPQDVQQAEAVPQAAVEPTQIERLRVALASALQEEKLVAVVAAEARSNWRASAWLLSRIHPTRWGERGREVPLAFPDDPDDPFREVDELAERRKRRPDGY